MVSTEPGQLQVDVLWYGRGATVAALAALLRNDGRAQSWPMLVPIRASGRRPPLFCVHTQGGNLFHYHGLAEVLDDDRPVYGLQACGVYGSGTPRHRLEDIASDAIEAMRTRQPRGPYRIIGFSSGGVVAFEMAQQLRGSGEQVAFVGLLDAFAPQPGFGAIFRRLLKAAKRLNRREIQELAYHCLFHGIRRPERRKVRSIGEAQRWAHWSYRPAPYDGEVTLFVAEESGRSNADPSLGWQPLVRGKLVTYECPGGHGTLVKAPFVATTAELLKACLRRADGEDANLAAG